MEFRADGSVSTSGSGGPDPYTQMLMGAVFNLLEKKKKQRLDTQEDGDAETSKMEIAEKGENPVELDYVEEKEKDKDNPVELAFFGMNDTGASSSSGSNNMFAWMDDLPCRAHPDFEQEGQDQQEGSRQDAQKQTLSQGLRLRRAEAALFLENIPTES